MTHDEAKAIVVAALMDLLDEGVIVRGDEHLVKDLRISSDDISMILLPTIEKIAGVHPRDRWSSVGTVNQIADLLVELSSG